MCGFDRNYAPHIRGDPLEGLRRPDSNYFCDGPAEEIIGGLTKVPGIRVIGRGSAALFRHRTLSLREIADRLNASFVLDGSLRQLGSALESL